MWQWRPLFCLFVKLKGLSSKNHLRVSTKAGKMVLHHERDGRITVEMGMPTFQPAEIPLRQIKKNSPIFYVSKTKPSWRESWGLVIRIV